MMGLTMMFDLLAAADNLSILDPASPSGESSRDQFILVLFITGGIFLLVEGVLVYMLIRNRRQRGNTDSQPPQVYGSQPMEIAWTAAPFLIVFVLFLLVSRDLWEIRVDPNKPPPGSKPLYVTVIGHQWWWEYRFTASPDNKRVFTTANEFYIPVSEPEVPRPVYLKLQSADVCHSFWLPRLGGKTDLIPGRSNSMWLQTGEEGLFLGQCSEYCGTSHANMLLRVRAVPIAEFDKWAANEEQPAVDAPASREGRDFFLSLSCVNCHTIRGTPASGTFGPELTHLMTRETLASGIMQNTAANIRTWVRNPQQFKQGCLMPAFALSDSELDKVVNYLTTLK
jgi:cytochrome c oxidase subunit 2